MKRRIMFRGKCAGTWRTGDHLTYREGDAIKHWMGSISPEYSVDPETVGQFTGAYDADGNEIFEDDICQLIGTDHRLKVGWDTSSLRFSFFTREGKQSKFKLHAAKNEQYKVIGNVFDNPELFERSKVS